MCGRIWRMEQIHDTGCRASAAHYNPTQISNENGVCIAKAGAFRKAETTGIVNLTAKYRHAETAPAEAERKILETTPFIDEMCERLKIYDKGE